MIRGNKTAEEIEEERLLRFVNKQPGAKQSPVSIHKQVQPEPVQSPQSTQKQWAYKQNQKPHYQPPPPDPQHKDAYSSSSSSNQYHHRDVDVSNNKTSVEIEEERLMKFVNKQPGVKASPVTLHKHVESVQQQQQSQDPQPLQKQWSYKQKKDNPTAPLLGNADMDLSTRINYLNNLYDQGTIDEKEYSERAAVLKIVAAIVEACIEGNTHELERLVNENPQIDLNIIKENESTLLHLATETIMTGRAEPRLLDILLSHGADINALRKGQTVLHSICDRASHPSAVECVRYLIQSSADVNAAPILKEGEESRKSIIALGMALESNGAPEIIRMMCEAGASPNTHTSDGPVLNYCIINQKNEEAKVLLYYRADPNSRENHNGATCLASAIASADAEMVKLLVSKGADRNAYIMNGQQATPGQLVASMSDTEGDFVRQVEHLFQ